MGHAKLSVADLLTPCGSVRMTPKTGHLLPGFIHKRFGDEKKAAASRLIKAHRPERADRKNW